MCKRNTGRTNPSRTTHGARTSPAAAAEMTVGGRRFAGRKVCAISGRGWYVASSGCTGAGCERGRTRSKSETASGSYSDEPMRSVTCSGSLSGVGGSERGGLEGFYVAT